jgi:integrase/recombinase XerD
MSPDAGLANTNLATCVAAYLNESLVRGHSRGTAEYRRVYLRQLQRWLGERGSASLECLTPSVLAGFGEHLLRRRTSYKRPAPTPLSSTTLAAAFSVLRSFGAWLVMHGLVSVDPARNLRCDRRAPPPQKPVLTVIEVERLLETPDESVLGVRDRAILETLYSTGLRRSELCALDLYDIDFCNETVMVRQGKGRRDRIAPIGATALRSLRRYLKEARPRLLPGEGEPAIFLASITRRRLGPKNLNRIVGVHSEKAGFGKRVTPHLLRHACATHLLQGGAATPDIQAILGHDTITSTPTYTRVGAEDLAAALARHHPRERRWRS